MLAAELDKNLPSADVVITSPYFPGAHMHITHTDFSTAMLVLLYLDVSVSNLKTYRAPSAAYLTRERLEKAKKLQLIINLSEGAGAFSCSSQQAYQAPCAALM